MADDDPETRCCQSCADFSAHVPPSTRLNLIMSAWRIACGALALQKEAGCQIQFTACGRLQLWRILFWEYLVCFHSARLHNGRTHAVIRTVFFPSSCEHVIKMVGLAADGADRAGICAPGLPGKRTVVAFPSLHGQALHQQLYAWMFEHQCETD